MKNRIITISFREIKTSFKRFLSLFILSMLGVGTFVGISKAAPDMMLSIDKYYDDNNVYDIKVMSNLGISKGDIKYINSIKGVKDSYGIFSKDVLIKNYDTEYVVKVIGINKNYNKVNIIKGRMPNNNKEIIVEQEFVNKANLEVGSYINLIDNDNTFFNNEMKIVGIVRSPLYITNVGSTLNRGNTTLGIGKINFYAYTDNSSFNLDYYTELDIIVNNAKKYITNSKEYNKIVKKVYGRIDKKKDIRALNRYNEIINEAQSKIQINENNGLLELNSAKNKLDDAKKELESGKNKLDSSKLVLDNSKSKLDIANNELEEYKKVLNDGKKELDDGKSKIKAAKFDLNEQLVKVGLTYDKINNIIKENDNSSEFIQKEIIYYYVSNIKLLDDEEKNLIISLIKDPSNIKFVMENIVDNEELVREKILNKIEDFDAEKIEDLMEFLKDKEKISYIYNLIINREEIIAELIENVELITAYENQYNEKLLEYNKGFLLYEENLKKYNDSFNQYEDGLSKYNNSLKIYNSSLSLYNSNLKEYYDSKKMLELKIKEAKLKLKEIPKGTWYIFDRLDDSSYSSFIDDGKSISNLSKVFPTIFFIVSVLISLISMSRMVEDDRILIGTLKSLGFKNKDIRKKYIIYSGLATILGGTFGAVLGFYILPRIIWEIYKIIFDIPVFNYDYNLKNAIIGIIISTICICGATLLTIKKVIKEKTASLLRGKAPKGGKRVFLERIDFIWKKLNFSKKITIRNLFRYKKRALMSIFGIAGCTSLMLVGFGIKDSIKDIANIQYKKVFHFDEMIYLSDMVDEEEIGGIFNNKSIKNYIKAYMDLSLSKDKYSLNLFVPADGNKLKNVLNLRDVKTKKSLILKDNEIVVSDKLASLTNTKKGDYFTFKDVNNKKYKFKVSAICENYAAHYIFMNKETFEKNLKKYKTNVVYANINNEKNENKIINNLMKNKNIMSIISVSSNTKTINDMLTSLNSVVLILIILSGSLSIVVLYNLSYINIVERKREIATLKVLGFTNKEVDNYITKETIILTIVGIVFGLMFGRILTRIIIRTVEIDMVRFLYNINLNSYIITSLLITLFTLIVNFIIHFVLKKINMIESLKSVE